MAYINNMLVVRVVHGAIPLGFNLECIINKIDQEF